MVAVHREVEKKYAADEAFVLPPLTELVAGLDGRPSAGGDGVTPVAEGEVVRHRLNATYFDTADLRLALAGLTLRRRTGGDDAGWHLKVPAGKDARSEVRLPVGRSARTVPAALQQMVWAHTKGAALQPVAEIATDRSVRRLVDATGHVMAEIADDRVTARRLLPLNGSGDAAGAKVSWREIEVELDDGGADLLDAVDARLRERGLREADAGSKLAHVLSLDSRATPAPSPVAQLTVKSAAGEVVLAHIRTQVEQVVTQDLPVRLDTPDAVHKMRVATRRLRSALATFKPLFSADVVGPMGDELKWLAHQLGAARDAEVMRDRVRAAVEADPEIHDISSAANEAARELEQSYRTAHDRVLADLNGERYHGILLSLDRLVTAPPFTERGARPAGKVLPKRVRQSFTQVRRLVKEAAATPAGAQQEVLLHDARKAAKRARYAGESVSPVFGASAATFAEAMEGVQEALGEHQDSVLTRARLRDMALQTSSTAAAFLYGRLHAIEEARAPEMQQHFDAAWRAAVRKSVHNWLH